MKTVALEDLVASTILTFCENAAELGCPREKEVDMWFRELSGEEMFKVGEKLLDIQERDAKMAKEELCHDRSDDVDAMKEINASKDKIIKMHEIELDLSDDTVEGLCQYSLEEIKDDKKALINYIANKILAKIVETDGKCLESLED